MSSALDALGAALGGGQGGPPSHIPVPGGGGPAGPSVGPSAGPSDADESTGGDGPDSPKVADLCDQAVSILQQAGDLEADAADKAKFSKWIAEIHAFLGEQQKLQDTAMGAGPGAKVIRKATSPGY